MRRFWLRGTLVFTSPAALTVADDVTLSGVTLQVSGSVMDGRRVWTRLLVAKSISGAPQLPYSNWESRIVALDDGSEAFEVRVISGSAITFR